MSDHATLDNDVRVAIFRYFVEHGRPPVAAEIASDLDATPLEVEDSYRRLHDDHLVVLAPGTPYIWLANPFSAVPTPYRAEVGGSDFFGNCIWDAFGIIAMLGGSGRVHGHCPDCGGEMSIDVFGRSLQPTEGLVHYAVPAAEWWDDIGFT